MTVDDNDFMHERIIHSYISVTAMTFIYLIFFINIFIKVVQTIGILLFP